MSTRQRERALRRTAARSTGNRPSPSPPVRVNDGELQDGDVLTLTPKGEALLAGIVDKAERDVPFRLLSYAERDLLRIVVSAIEMEREEEGVER